MRDMTQTAIHMAERRHTFLEKGFELFSAKSIEAVTLEDVAAASGHGVATVYRYFSSKNHFLVEIARWKWEEFFRENRKRRPSEAFEGKTARDMFAFYLDSFLELYRRNKDLLRFNQFFNVYIRSQNVDPESVEMYRGLMKPITDFFHAVYAKATQDRTLDTDVPMEEMLSTTLHLMLAVVTRYAVGLVYQPAGGFDEEKELDALKEMLLLKYSAPFQQKEVTN